ncbi:hypothetical protein SDC9_161151 [bioreactor metagenome]|uniref:Uncharacterized protein n=1 Tax=bioreactor metagenome TaxID=1076179 RepID=A0A645FHC5_9ZZZZ
MEEIIDFLQAVMGRIHPLLNDEGSFLGNCLIVGTSHLSVEVCPDDFPAYSGAIGMALVTVEQQKRAFGQILSCLSLVDVSAALDDVEQQKAVVPVSFDCVGAVTDVMACAYEMEEEVLGLLAWGVKVDVRLDEDALLVDFHLYLLKAISL